MEFPSADRGPGLPIDLQSIDFSPAVSAIAIGNEYLSIIAQQSVDGQKNTELEKMTQAESIIGDITQGDIKGTAKRENFREKYGELAEKLSQLGSRQQQLTSAGPGITTQGPQPTQQSFTQQETSFSNNTSALTALAGSIATLNSALSNLNNAPGSPSAAGTQQSVAQPNVTTTTTAPVSVVVNAPGGQDIASAVGAIIQGKIPEIVEKVRIAMGQKVAPTVSRPPLTTNPKLGAGQRADGGFLL